MTLKTHYTALTNAHIATLMEIVGTENISTTQADKEHHSHDQGGFPAHLPDVVIYAQTTEQVSAILKFANTEKIPVTAWGAGTSLEGNPVPVYGGILLSMAQMTRILDIHMDDFQVTVEPGLGYKDMNKDLARYGLVFAPDPGANASIGGMLANNAAGIRTVRYGATKDNVLRLKVVLADGRIVELGSRSVKQSSGYDLLHLIVGSEGTLGIITEATLKLVPIAAHISAVVASFQSVEAAVEAVVAVRGSGLDPAALEFLDAFTAKILGQNDALNLTPYPTLFMEFHAAHEETLTAGIDMLREICDDLDALSFEATTDNAERMRLWRARHHAYETLTRQFPGKAILLNDVAVPISAYPELISFIDAQRDKHDFTAIMLGHAGDGNIHVMFPYGDDADYQIAESINAAVVLKALALDGTSTGEHGVGVRKAKYLQQEHGIGLEMMRAIKQTFDPNNILNPGKIFP